MNMRQSRSVLINSTIAAAAARIIRRARKPLGPAEIASRGKRTGLLRVPRGRTRGYLTQLLQSALYQNAFYVDRPSSIVRRIRHGKYAAR